MDLEDQLLGDLSKKLASDIDQHILIGFMISLGWHEVIVDPWIHNNLSEIQDWIKENIHNNNMWSGNRWVFENEKDAIIFALKWA